MSQSVSKNLGVITAYGMAVQGGFTGTKEQFYNLLSHISNFIVVEHMPTAKFGAPSLIYYLGTTDANYTYGHFYKLTQNGGNYSWTSNGPLGLQQDIVTIPSATSQYMCNSDGCYQHTPLNASTYVLPNITDSNKTHQVVIYLNYETVESISFEDTDGNTIQISCPDTPQVGQKFMYICDSQFGQWKIYGVRS